MYENAGLHDFLNAVKPMVTEKWDLSATVWLFNFPGLWSHLHQRDVPTFCGFGFWKMAHLQECQSRRWREIEDDLALTGN